MRQGDLFSAFQAGRAMGEPPAAASAPAAAPRAWRRLTARAPCSAAELRWRVVAADLSDGWWRSARDAIENSSDLRWELAACDGAQGRQDHTSGPEGAPRPIGHLICDAILLNAIEDRDQSARRTRSRRRRNMPWHDSFSWRGRHGTSRLGPTYLRRKTEVTNP